MGDGKVHLFSTECHDFRTGVVDVVVIFKYDLKSLLGIGCPPMEIRAGVAIYVEIKNLLRDLASEKSALRPLEICTSAQALEFDKYLGEIAKKVMPKNVIYQIIEAITDVASRFSMRRDIQSAIFTYNLYCNCLWYIKHGKFNWDIWSAKKDTMPESTIDALLQHQENFGYTQVGETLVRDVLSNVNFCVMDLTNIGRRLNKPESELRKSCNDYLVDLRLRELR